MFYHNGMGAYYGDKMLKKRQSVKYGFNLVYFARKKNAIEIRMNYTNDIGPFEQYYRNKVKSGKVLYRRVRVSAQLKELTMQIQKAYASYKFAASNECICGHLSFSPTQKRPV
jgi:hypothetical protein